MKTAMQDMIEWIEQRFNNPQETEVFKKATELLKKEKEQIIAPVDRLCDFYGHPYIGEQMYNTWYVEPILKPINQNK